jgi:hypothetical protein
MKAWLITWEWVGDHAKVKKSIVAIMSFRSSAHRMRETVEQIYVNERYSLGERVEYAKSKKSNPYRAYLGTYKGAHCLWEVYCGHNPHLYARIVSDLKVEINRNGKETLTWKEPRDWIDAYTSGDAAT